MQCIPPHNCINKDINTHTNKNPHIESHEKITTYIFYTVHGIYTKHDGQYINPPTMYNIYKIGIALEPLAFLRRHDHITYNSIYNTSVQGI